MSHLLPNEKLTFRPEEIAGDPPADQEINEKYSKGEVRIVTEQARYPLGAVPALLDSGNYKLNPEFQRRHRWDTEKQSRLIESFIMNVPIPPIFLYEDSFSHYEVMDGLQRLTAIKDFYGNKFVLEGLEEWEELNGRSYSDLPELVRKGIDRRYLSSIILLQETAKDEREALRLKQLVFERINSGGIKLAAQESRNAIYNGRLNQLCIKLARNAYLCKMWGIPEPDNSELVNDDIREEVLKNDLYREMQDVELVLRFFAYRQRLELHQGAQRDYFDNFLKLGNLWPTDVLQELEELFKKTIKLVWDVFGESAFWLWRKRGSNWNWNSRPTLVIYEPLMFVFSQHIEDASALIARRDIIEARLPEFYQDNYDDFEGRHTNKSHVTSRNNLLEEFISGILAENFKQNEI